MTQRRRLTLVLLAGAACALMAAGCSTSEGGGSASTERCGTTLLGNQELCGDDLVAFCQERYDPDVNEEVCAPALRDAGIDPNTLVPQPPKPETFGEPARFEGADGEMIVVTPRRILENVTGGEYEQPEPGNRYVGVDVKIANRGDSSVSDFPNGKLRLSNGRQVEPTIMLGGDCGSDDFSSVDLAAGDSVTGCMPFEIPGEAEIVGFQMRIGTEGFVGRWKVTPHTDVVIQ